MMDLHSLKTACLDSVRALGSHPQQWQGERSVATTVNSLGQGWSLVMPWAPQEDFKSESCVYHTVNSSQPVQLSETRSQNTKVGDAAQ